MKKLHKSDYCGSFKQVNWAALDDEWKTTDKLPSPSRSKKVLIIKEKHGEDVDVVFGWWMPCNGYTEGYFEVNKQIVPMETIYYYRTLDFLEYKNYE